MLVLSTLSLMVVCTHQPLSRGDCEKNERFQQKTQRRRIFKEILK